jgi:NAD(P)-dependent dehydrogenase (short-subunit alcohol dehydrogenase family)
MKLRNAVVLITGGTRGLGIVLARELGARGAAVAVCARDEREVEAASRDLSEGGIDAYAAVCDVTDRDQAGRFVAAVTDRFGRIDALINDAGSILVGPMAAMEIEDYRAVMEVNFFGALHMMEAVLPAMRRRRAGSIVNIASVGGLIPVPHLAPYVASKFALVGFSQTARAELAKDGINVITINPGLMRTGSPENATFKGTTRAEYAWFAIADAQPFVSMRAEDAARRIVAALEDNKPWDVLGLPAQAGALAYALFPAAVVGLLALVNRLLPAAPKANGRPARGHESGSALAPSVFTAANDEAAAANNERSARRSTEELPG